MLRKQKILYIQNVKASDKRLFQSLMQTCMRAVFVRVVVCVGEAIEIQLCYHAEAIIRTYTIIQMHTCFRKQTKTEYEACLKYLEYFRSEMRGGFLDYFWRHT